MKFVNIAKHVRAHPDYESKVANNMDTQTRGLTFVKIFDDIMNKQRRTELELNKQIAQDSSFKQAMQDTVRRIIGIM